MQMGVTYKYHLSHLTTKTNILLESVPACTYLMYSLVKLRDKASLLCVCYCVYYMYHKTLSSNLNIKHLLWLNS